MAKAMTIQRLATLVCKREGKKKQVDRAQVLEILTVLSEMEAEFWVKSAGFLHRGTPLGALDTNAQKKYNANLAANTRVQISNIKATKARAKRSKV